jgi:hypothetical protein
MTSTALEAYLSQLERELRKRGLQDGRIIDEGREHLVDAVEDGLQRGLSMDAAESSGTGEVRSARDDCGAFRYEAASHVDSGQQLAKTLVGIRGRSGRTR